MKILLYGLNFAPERTGIGKYSGEMAAWLAAAGHDVRVVTAPPYYPAWRVDAGYSAWRSSAEQWRGVRVVRSPLWVPAHPTGASRVLHLLSFALLSIPALARQLAWKPDVVITVAPAFACAPGGWLAARLCSAKAWLHVQDFEIDAAFKMGFLKGGLARRSFAAFEGWMLRRFDRVSTISGRMLQMLRDKGVDDARAVLFPNWVDIGAIAPARPPVGSAGYRAELGIAEDAIVALYSGTMGGKQGLELLPAAARTLRSRLPKLVIVLCGDGVCKPGLERDSAGLDNVRFLPLQPASRLGELLAMADIHLLPQDAGAADLVMPSKLTGMLASGRPVLTTALPQTELATVVTGLGLVVPPNDRPAFNAALVRLAESPAMRAELGAAGRCYAEKHLATDRVLIEFEYGLRRCVGPTGRSKLDTLTAPRAPTADKPGETI